MEKVKTITDILQDDGEEIVEDYYAQADEIYDLFDEHAYKKGQGYKCPDYPIFSEKLEGLEQGLYIFAGESNSGKTAIMTNIMWSFCKNPENKLFGIYYSLDDNTEEVIPRLIAMNQRIPISVGSKPMVYQTFIDDNKEAGDTETLSQCELYQEYLDKRELGLKELREANKQFLVLDRQRITSFEQLVDHAKKVQMYVKRFDPENNIIIGIDSLADLTSSTQKFSSDTERINYISMAVKKASNIDLNVPIFTSYHVRKLNRDGRPTLDDLKDSSRIVYEASLVFLVYNDVSKNKQGASIYYTVSDDNEKHPIIELDWAKNKKSSFKGRTYHYFVPNFSKVTECKKEELNRFDSIVYTKK